MSGEYSSLYVTFPTVELARKVANELVAKQYATFINIIPSMLTVYREEQKSETDTEVLVIAKIRTKLAQCVLKLVEELHPYDIPEMYTVPISNINEKLRKNLETNLKNG